MVIFVESGKGRDKDGERGRVRGRESIVGERLMEEEEKEEEEDEEEEEEKTSLFEKSISKFTFSFECISNGCK